MSTTEPRFWVKLRYASARPGEKDRLRADIDADNLKDAMSLALQRVLAFDPYELKRSPNKFNYYVHLFDRQDENGGASYCFVREDWIVPVEDAINYHQPPGTLAGIMERYPEMDRGLAQTIAGINRARGRG